MSLPFRTDADVDAAAPQVMAHVAAGGLLAYPTETVYGFGGATDFDSVESLVHMKGRPAGKPFLILVASSEMVTRLDLRLEGYASRLAARHWPGPLTLVLGGGERRLPERLRGPEGGVAVRWTSHPNLTRLLKAYGEPLTSTSANRPGVPPAMTAREIEEQWSAEIGRGMLRVLDGGRLIPSPPSTVVDCMGARARVIRPGAISSATLRESVPDLIGDL